MGKHRNAHSLLADAQKRVTQLKVRVAKDIVNDDPAISAIDENINSLKRDMLKVNRWLDEKHGLAASISKWTQRVAEAEVNLANAEKTKKDFLAEATRLTSLKSMPLSQYKIRGDILIFDPDTNPLKKSHTAKEAKFHQERAFIQANIELVNLHTGRLLVKKIFTASSGTGRKIFNLNLTEDTDYRSDKFKSHSIGRALWQLNDQVQMFIYKTLNAVPLEGDLIWVDHKNNSAIINLGKANGIKVRDVFTVFSVEPSFKDPVDKVDLGER